MIFLFFFFLGHNTGLSSLHVCFLFFSLFTRIMYKIGPGSVEIRRSPVSCFYMIGFFFFFAILIFSFNILICYFLHFFLSASVLVLKAGSYFFL